MAREELHERMWSGLLHLNRTLGRCMPDAEVLDFGEVVTTIVPGSPSMLVNSAAAASGPRLLELLHEIRTAYRAAGMERFGVWIDAEHRDGAVVEALTSLGMRLDSTPAPMGAWLADLDLAPEPGAIRCSPETVGAVNDVAYGNADQRMRRLLAELAPDAASSWSIEIEGEPACVVQTARIGDEVPVWWVATDPRFRGRGLATSLMRHALHAEREAGARSTTLQASKLGAPIYARMGYRTLGALEFWEIPPPAASAQMAPSA